MKLLLIAGVLAVLVVAEANDCACPTSILKYYKELNCNPIKPAGSCCPTSFDCQASLSSRDPEKCHLKGVQYEPKARISSEVVGDPCVPQCICNKYGPVASLQCVTSECPELFGSRTAPNCVRTYTQGRCCATGLHCDNATTPATAKAADTCEYAGKTYVRGQQFYPAEAPCKKCLCQQGYDGTLNGPWCTEISCGIEIHYGNNIHDGCAPVFFGTKGCCPIGWRCPTSTDRVVAAPGKQSPVSAKCKFGSLTLNVGDSVSQEKSCQVCKCTIPPHVSCVQAGYC